MRAWILAAGLLVACSNLAPKAFGAELLECVRASDTREAYEACKQGVEKRYAPLSGYDAGQ